MPAPVSHDVSRASPAGRGLVRVASVGGTTVHLSLTCLVVVALLAVGFAPRAEAASPGMGASAFVLGAGVGVLIYLAALLHEAGHALVARRHGHAVPSITLSAAGGRTAVAGAARTPAEELLTAGVGPAVSIALGLIALGARAVVDDGLLAAVLEVLVLANLVLGLLDLLPAPPLDGGRVVRALGWWVGGSPAAGAATAVWCGRLVAVLVLALPLVLAVTGSPLPWPALLLVCSGLAVLLWLSAGAERVGTVRP